MPFLDTLKDNPRVFVRFNDDGPGHRAISPSVLREMFTALSTSLDRKRQISDAGFVQVSKYFSSKEEPENKIL